MEHSNDERNLKRPFTIFGEPVIKTRCQRNALITGISGGIVSGLIAFLFTSQAKRSMNIAVGSYFAISFTMACYCAYEEYELRKQARELRATVYNLKQIKKVTDSNDLDM